MPIEIRELHVRVSVSQQPTQAASAPQAATRTSGSSTTPDTIITTCVDQVLQILESKRER